jgi:hypothetical protein
MDHTAAIGTGATLHALRPSQIVAKAWADADFKKRLLAEPAAVLKEHGAVVPASVHVKVVEDTEKVRHLILASRPARELTAQELETVAEAYTPMGFSEKKPAR